MIIQTMLPTTIIPDIRMILFQLIDGVFSKKNTYIGNTFFKYLPKYMKKREHQCKIQKTAERIFN